MSKIVFAKDKHKNVTELLAKKSASLPVYWRCTKGHIFMMSMTTLRSSNHECPFCQQYTLGHPMIKYEHQSIAIEVDPVEPASVKDESPFSQRMTKWVCSKCEYHWSSQIDTRTIRGVHCPRCKQSKRITSKIEVIVGEWLNQQEWEWTSPLMFGGCVDSRDYPLPFDYCAYLPQVGKLLLIQCDGKVRRETLISRVGDEQLRNQWVKDKKDTILIRVPFETERKINIYLNAYKDEILRGTVTKGVWGISPSFYKSIMNGIGFLDIDTKVVEPLLD